MSASLNHPVVEALHASRLVPVIVLQRVVDALPLAEALSCGGLPVMEITLRSEVGLSCIAEVAKQGRWTVGAGTVLHREQARQAIDSGAQFIVAPGLDEPTVQYCQDRKVPVFPGVCTATEAQRAVNLGLQVVKFFPAAAFGGVSTIRALSGPFPQLQFIPTGGITREQLDDYLALPSVLAVGGSWMVAGTWIEQQEFQRITAAAQAAVAQVKQQRADQLGDLG
jgi:2-dehydro-3-deoxyphosphogluconate aldolase/(4S)-4-hydroxy-2-oxoglutarate aldolase